MWQKAQALPTARDSDFFGSNRKPPGAAAEHLRIINDTSLRSRLIDAGIAEGLQSPKGPQKIPSIIRLYPNFDAPVRNGKGRGGRPAVETPRGAYGLPSVEDLNTLLARIQAVEVEVSRELQAKVNADVDRLKREIGHLEGDDFDRAFRALQAAIEARRELAGQVREEAFRRIDADHAFAQRSYLRLISREPKRHG